MAKQFSQIVAEYPAPSIRTKLSEGTRSLLNAQVAIISNLGFRQDFSLAGPALKHSGLQSALLPTRGSERLFQQVRNSY